MSEQCKSNNDYIDKETLLKMIEHELSANTQLLATYSDLKMPDPPKHEESNGSDELDKLDTTISRLYANLADMYEMFMRDCDNQLEHRSKLLELRSLIEQYPDGKLIDKHSISSIIDFKS